MTFGPPQGPPPPKNTSQEGKEEEKKFIENVLCKYDSLSESAMVNLMWLNACRTVQVRAAFEVINMYEKNPEEAVKKFKIQKDPNAPSEISVSLEEVSKNIWIPKEMLENNVIWRNGFNIFGKDEINLFSLDPKNENQELDFKLVSEILEKKTSTPGSSLLLPNDKLELFLNNKEWRSKAKEYCVLVLKRIENFSTGMISKSGRFKERAEIFSQNEDEKTYPKKENECLNVLKSISLLYLEEIS